MKANPFLMLGAGAALATCALFLMSQGIPPSGSHSGTWGPPKKNVVNVFEKFPTAQTIQPGQELVVYTVPSDRWLTLTACQIWTAHSPDLLWGEKNGLAFTAKGIAHASALNNWNSFWWGLGIPVDPYGNSAVGGYPLGLPFSPDGTSGWVFKPGSQVVVKNTGTTPRTFEHYSISGYLSRE